MTEHALLISKLRCTLGDRVLFDGLDLAIAPGESAVILGPSGSGKSTLLSCVLGLIAPDAGAISVAGNAVTEANRSQIARIRAGEIGMVFQFGELLPELSPVENVALAALLAGHRGEVVYERARAFLNELGVPESETVATLSGGERQRTAVARALINEPALLLADEPTGALDTANRDRVAQMLFAIPRTHACGLLVVTHDLAVAERADVVYTIQDGALVRARSPRGQR
ncbi:ABC transporter ATP-binding protein [Glycomyces sp. NRRL B-16210]|uniref:ABC transporter ATP-binding protein n=1 Tax=Glycomyces sp. NRRL B-16210 TaxID=1463821 RepID=UPI0004C29B5C|nr:ATP-binding cassette domain-containing protein [Glycomyces sp. NRRL B-16210]